MSLKKKQDPTDLNFLKQILHQSKSYTKGEYFWPKFEKLEIKYVGEKSKYHKMLTVKQSEKTLGRIADFWKAEQINLLPRKWTKHAQVDWEEFCFGWAINEKTGCCQIIEGNHETGEQPGRIKKDFLVHESAHAVCNMIWFRYPEIQKDFNYGVHHPFWMTIVLINWKQAEANFPLRKMYKQFLDSGVRLANLDDVFLFTKIMRC